MAKLLPLLILLACCAIPASARRPLAPMSIAAATPSPREMPVPCYMKIFAGFCFTSSDKGACTFYANPSYATYKQCAEDPNMGKTVKCAEVNNDLKSRYADDYKTCTDKEVLQGNSGSSSSGSGSGGGASVSWSQQGNRDVPGKDIPGNGKSFTEVCQRLEEVQKVCARTSGCAGFAFNGSCGYLKTSLGETKGRDGWTVFVIKK